MGLDLSSIPVRLASAPMRRIRTDAQAWRLAHEHPPFADHPMYGPHPEISYELLAELPSGLRHDWSHHFAGRTHQQAEYLPDPVGHHSITSWTMRERSLPYRIIYGDQVFADHAHAGQDHPWRCSTAAFLTEAVARIDAIDQAAARRVFSVADMYTTGIYKVHASGKDDDTFEQVMNDLRQFADHCREIATMGLDLIMTIN
jgi:hypothetical protein